MVSSGKEKSLDFKGITSSRIIIDLNDDSYSKLVAENQVFLADLSDTIIRLENGDYNSKLKIRVPDLSWKIGDITKN